MQFIPSTWQVVKVDADGDGQRNPQDIDDASLATAVYLCSGKDNLSNRSGQEAAVYRYNHCQDYVNLVLRIMEAYSSGDYTAVPSGTYGGASYSSRPPPTPRPSTRPTSRPRSATPSRSTPRHTAAAPPATAARARPAPAAPARRRDRRRHRRRGRSALAGGGSAAAAAPVAPTRSATPSRASTDAVGGVVGGVTGGGSAAAPVAAPAVRGGSSGGSHRWLVRWLLGRFDRWRRRQSRRCAVTSLPLCSTLAAACLQKPGVTLPQLTKTQHRTPGHRPGVLSFR